MANANPLQFIQQVRSEVAKVVWPTRREVLLTTIMVFIMAALTATFFSLVDMAIRGGLSLGPERFWLRRHGIVWQFPLKLAAWGCIPALDDGNRRAAIRVARCFLF